MSKKTITKPKLSFLRQPYGATCMEMVGLDLTIRCDYKCLYCHYEEITARELNIESDKAVGVDISSIYEMKDFPPWLYLSPYSEPFGEKSWKLAYELMSFLLPKGIGFWILTKSVIPNEIIKLIAHYPKQIEIAVVVANLDKERNSIVEPNCPTAEERLANIPKLLKTDCRFILRMDPLIPLLDDSTEKLKAFVERAAELQVKDLLASYLMIPADLFKRLKKIPLVRPSLKLFKDKSPTSAGMALSVPLEAKLKKYDEINRLCGKKGIFFRVCGCRELRIKDHKVNYSIECR